MRGQVDEQGDALWARVARLASGFEHLRLTQRVDREVRRALGPKHERARVVLATAQSAAAIEPLVTALDPALTHLPSALLTANSMLFAPYALGSGSAPAHAAWAMWRCAAMWARAAGEVELAARFAAQGPGNSPGPTAPHRLAS